MQPPETEPVSFRNLSKGTANMSNFDSQSFLNTQREGGFSTEYPVVPDDEYVAFIRRPKEGGKPTVNVRSLDSGQLVMDLNWTIEDEKAKAATGMGVAYGRQSVWLDVSADGTSLERGKGKNVQLGLLLDAMGLNDGRPIDFGNMLYDRPCKVRTKSRVDDSTGKTYVDVKGVAKL
jgi:hypothetical protein